MVVKKTFQPKSGKDRRETRSVRIRSASPLSLSPSCPFRVLFLMQMVPRNPEKDHFVGLFCLCGFIFSLGERMV